MTEQAVPHLLSHRIRSLPAFGFLGVLLLFSCAGAPVDSSPETVAQATPEPEAEEPGEGVPSGFQTMSVFSVVQTDAGPAVVLTDAFERVLLPIFVGQSEALVISLRLHGQGFERPLTHDLLDALIRELNAELVEVRIDSLQDDAFVATLRIRTGERVFMLDSRASDSIALALGHNVPIYVSDRVLGQAGIRPGAGHSGPLAPPVVTPPADAEGVAL